MCCDCVLLISTSKGVRLRDGIRQLLLLNMVMIVVFSSGSHFGLKLLTVREMNIAFKR